MQEALQDVEYLTEQRVSVLHSLLAWHSAHTGNAALASEAEFEGLEAEVVRLQAPPHTRTPRVRVRVRANPNLTLTLTLTLTT